LHLPPPKNQKSLVMKAERMKEEREGREGEEEKTKRKD
jgi:hypothetical protein